MKPMNNKVITIIIITSSSSTIKTSIPYTIVNSSSIDFKSKLGKSNFLTKNSLSMKQTYVLIKKLNKINKKRKMKRLRAVVNTLLILK